MRVAIHQPNYLPWIGFFDKMDLVDKFVLLNTAMYSKDKFINRNKIRTLEGRKWLTVPIGGKRRPIKQLEIDNSQNWRRKHWAIISNSYRNSPYWNEYNDGFNSIYHQDWDKVVDLNICIINHIKSLLGINTEIYIESDFGVDFGSGNIRNINIVKELRADTYVSGTGANVYNDESKFKQNNIQLIYQDFQHPVYPQMKNEFESHLSIIDMLFHCGPETMSLIRNGRDKSKETMTGTVRGKRDA